MSDEPGVQDLGLEFIIEFFVYDETDQGGPVRRYKELLDQGFVAVALRCGYFHRNPSEATLVALVQAGFDLKHDGLDDIEWMAATFVRPPQGHTLALVPLGEEFAGPDGWIRAILSETRQTRSAASLEKGMDAGKGDEG